jgi:hypothetical protein
MAAIVDMTDPRRQRRRIIVTAVIVGAIALAFYVAVFVRFWK